MFGRESLERIVMAGDSAGAGLALSVMMQLRDAGEALPRAAYLSLDDDLTASDR